MNPKPTFIRDLSVCAVAFWVGGSANGQTVDQSVQTHQMNGTALVEWYAHAGRTYFLQATTDLGPVQSWTWMDVIEVGADGLISHE